MVSNNDVFLILNFRRILNVVCFLLGNSPGSEIYMPTFRNTLSVPSSLADRCRMTMFKKYRGIHREISLARKWPVTILSTGLGHLRAKPFSLWIPPHFLNIVILHLSYYEEGTECSETSAYKIQTPRNYAEESIQRIMTCGVTKSYLSFEEKYCCHLQGWVKNNPYTLKNFLRNKNEVDLCYSNTEFCTINEATTLLLEYTNTGCST